jgi:galactonate dehydratase
MKHPLLQVRRARLALSAQAAQPADRSLEVSNVSAYILREPASRRSYTIIRLRAASGLIGYGECRAITAADVERARAALAGVPASAYELAYRRLGAVPAVRAAIDMALLDILGKQARAPVYQVLGGPTRTKARTIARISGESDDEVVAAMKRRQAAGFRGFTVSLPPAREPNPRRAYVAASQRRLEALRSAASAADFVVDGGGALLPKDAAELCAAFEHFRLLWFDEPCSGSNTAVIQKMAAETVTPLGFGAGLEGADAFQDLLRADAVDVLRPELAIHGISGIRRRAALGETYYVAVAPRHDGGPIATAAALHLAASIPNFFAQETPAPEAEEDRRFRASLTGGTEIERAADGFLKLPTGPGLGISVNEQMLEKNGERVA